MSHLKRIIAAGLILCALFFQPALSHAAHDTMINPFADGKDYPQNPTEDFFIESGDYILNFSSFCYLEEVSYFIKLVVTVKAKEGKLYTGPLQMRIFTDPFWGEKKLLAKKEFTGPYENRYMFYLEAKNSGAHKVVVVIPGVQGEVPIEFPMTVGSAGKGPLYIGASAVFFVLGLLAFIFVSKRKGGAMPERQKRTPRSVVTSLWITAFLSAMLTVSPLSSARAYTHHSSLIQWNEYSEAVFARAREENKPIFMLVTAVWCHWCHVYEEKTLETAEVAEYLNKNYVPIFLDYDKRKDISGRYQASGLPITVIMAPNGEELVSVPGYIEKDQLVANLTNTVVYINTQFVPSEQKAAAPPKRAAAPVTKEGLQKLMTDFNNITEVTVDPSFGGFGTSSKKPFPEIWDYVLTYYESVREKKWLDLSTMTLDWMAGIKKKEIVSQRPSFQALQSLYHQVEKSDWIDRIHDLQEKDPLTGLLDPVEGGFFRYATKRDWTIPHYEKLLEDNADLINLYLHAFQITEKKEYREAARGSLNYVMANFYDNQDHRFYGSQDADEIYYHFTAEERKKVKAPRIDTTSYSRTNARMAMALFTATQVLNKDQYRETAEKVLGFVKKHMISGHGVISYHDPKEGQKKLNGLLEDNAWVALAFLEAYHQTGNREYLQTTDGLLGFLMDKFHDRERGGFYARNSTSTEFYKANELLLKEKPYEFNGVVSYLLVRYDEIVKNKEYLAAAEKSLGLFIGDDAYTTSPYFQRVALYLLNGNSGVKR